MQRRDVQQAQCHVIDRGWIPTLELQLDFAEGFRDIAFRTADLALVEGRLDPSGRSGLERNRRTPYGRLELRPQLLGNDGIVQAGAGLRGCEVGTVAVDHVFPLAAG